MNRFNKEELNENYGRKLLSFSYNGKEFQIRATEHCINRLQGRGININTSIGDIISLGKETLYEYTEKNQDCIIINEKENISTVITFENLQIRISTVIPKSNVWVRKGTKIFRYK